MTREEFEVVADEYDEQTGCHSFPWMMASTPAFAALMEAGVGAVPLIIEAFERYDAGDGTSGHWGMHWVLVLESLTHDRPLQPVVEHGFAKWDVDATCRAWVEWANRQARVPRFTEV